MKRNRIGSHYFYLPIKIAKTIKRRAIKLKGQVGLKPSFTDGL